MSTVPKLGPTAATRTSASKIVGKDSEMSTSRMSRESVRPPKYPEIRPSAVPMMPPTKIAMADTVRETRAPCISRLRMTSRNMRIESATTGYRRASRKASAIRGRAYQGSDRAVTVAIEIPPSLVADSRVEVCVQDVDQEVRHNEDRREHDHDGLDDLVVPSSHGVDGEQPGAGPGEDGLGHDGSGHQDAGDDREEGQRGDRRIPEAVLPDDFPLGESLDSSQLHELGVQHIQHRGADQSHDGRDLEPAEGEGGKDHVLDPAAARGR